MGIGNARVDILGGLGESAVGAYRLVVCGLSVVALLDEVGHLAQGHELVAWKPWSIGVQDSHLHLATHTGILTSKRSSTPFGMPSMLFGTLPYHLYISAQIHRFGTTLSPG